MEGFIILGAIAYLVLWYFIGAEFRRIAAMKGHDEARYFWWTFLMPPVGMLMVVALPDRMGAKPAAPVQDEQLPAL